MGGERLLDDRGQFNGAYGWRDVRKLVTSTIHPSERPDAS
jgi:hypothetical protein